MLKNLKVFLLDKVYYKINNVNRITAKVSKRALLSYSVLHFRKGAKKFIHPNTIESRVILKVLTDKGYRVDVYNNTYKGDINFSLYSLILGEGMPLFTYFKKTKNKLCRIIYYATGSHPFFQTKKSVQALVRFKVLTNSAPIESLRIVPVEWGVAASLADRCVVIGNEETRKTFIEQGLDDVVTIEPPFFKINSYKGIYSENRKKAFLWFGSFGYLHKGLDIVLEFFTRRTDLELYICGYSDRERLFWNSYSNHKNITFNIHDCGFVDVRSNKFLDLLKKCGAVILLSASEGCSTALLTVIGNGGLIPIASRSCGINIDAFGFNVVNNNENDLEEAISRYLKSDLEILDRMSAAGRDFVNNIYTESNYYNKLFTYIE